ncbi:hypothetical protein BOX15_Mlig007063g1, partial [Macrostomum lignano]
RISLTEMSCYPRLPLLIGYLLLLVCGAPCYSRPAKALSTVDSNETQNRTVDFESAISNGSLLSDGEVREAVAYLQKFGYLNSLEPSAQIHALLNSTNSTDEIDSGSDIDNSTALDSIDLAEAVSKFQTVYQLPMTGLLDLATLAAMREGRCGVADAQFDSSSRAARRPKRSTPIRVEMDAEPRRFDTRNLSWRLARMSERLNRNQVTKLIRRAFSLWASVAPLRFSQVFNEQEGTADIEIGFYRGSHNCQRRFDGPGGDAAHTQAASAIHIDIEEEFQLSDNRPVRQRGAVHLLRLLVHEIGHLLGLGHSSHLSSIMHPSSVNAWPALLRRPTSRVPAALIGRDEIRLVRQRYGPCSPRIDAIIDWRYELGRGFESYTRVVSRGSVWTQGRGGYPDSLGCVWPGLDGRLDRVDAVLQAESPDGRALISLAFSGAEYFVMNSSTGALLSSAAGISADFSRRTGEQYGIPESIDAAYYDYAKRTAVFIKGDWAFEYDLLQHNGSLRKNNCCVRHVKLNRMFPEAPNNLKPLVTPLDAAYYRRSDSTVFLISGQDFWYYASNIGPVDRTSDANEVLPAQPKLLHYGGKVHQQWRNLCSMADARCSLHSG